MYHTNFVKKKNNFISYSNRGMTLENDINETNTFYLNNSIALIYKKPTPIAVTKVDYTNVKIKEAYFMSSSTLDYNGIYKGTYLDFDAKETINKTSYPLTNIHKHQLEHIRRVIAHGGISFLIVRFTTWNNTYLLLGTDLIDFIDNNKRKSIPYEYFENNCHKIEIKYIPRLDYLKVLDKTLEERKNEKKNTSN